MPIVNDPTYGPKPAQTTLAGRPTTLPSNSTPFSGAGIGRSVAMIGGGWRTVSFTTLYRTQPWVATAARRLSEQIARLPLQASRYLDADQTHRERDKTHPGARLLERPGGRTRPGFTGFNLRWQIALGLYVQGHYLGWKRSPSVGAPPNELWTLDWRLVIPHRIGNAGPVIAWEWCGDSDSIPGLKRGQYLDPADVVSIGFDVGDGSDIGVSPLEQLGVTLALEDASQRYQASSFRNGQRYGSLVILDKSVNADKVVRDGVREELVAAHSGLEQAFRPAILGGGVNDIKSFGQTAVEAELIEQRKINREEVTGVYGLIGPLAGLLESGAYASLVEYHRLLYVTFLAGPLGLVSSSLTAQVLEHPAWIADGLFAEFNLDAVLSGDAKSRWETYQIALQSGGLTLNDVRRAENQAPYGDPRADEPLIAANNVRPLSSVGTDAAPADPLKGIGNGILALVGKHAGQAFDRAAEGVRAGKTALEAFDRDRAEVELKADLEALGVNGSSSYVAQAVARELEDLLGDAKGVDDVRRIRTEYAGGPR